MNRKILQRKHPMSDESKATKTRLIPLTEWPKYHEWPPIGGLRHLVFYGSATGFNQVIKRVGRRVLIDENAFFDWVNANNPKF